MLVFPIGGEGFRPKRWWSGTDLDEALREVERAFTRGLSLGCRMFGVSLELAPTDTGVGRRLCQVTRYNKTTDRMSRLFYEPLEWDARPHLGVFNEGGSKP